MYTSPYDGSNSLHVGLVVSLSPCSEQELSAAIPPDRASAFSPNGFPSGNANALAGVSLPLNSARKVPAELNHSMRPLPWSSTYTCPVAWLTATAAGLENWPAPEPATPDLHPSVQVSSSPLPSLTPQPKALPNAWPRNARAGVAVSARSDASNTAAIDTAVLIRRINSPSALIWLSSSPTTP